MSDKFLSSGIMTIKQIFSLQVLKLKSEMDLVKALERYILANQEKCPEVAKSVRPAINLIRFLTLKTSEIVQTSLLTAEEIINVIACLPPQQDLSKMPQGLSVSKRKRHFINQLSMVMELNDIYSAKICPYSCTYQHALWDCPKIAVKNYNNKALLAEIFKKYNHTLLMEYNLQDLQTVYDIYKMWNFIKTA